MERRGEEEKTSSVVQKQWCNRCIDNEYTLPFLQFPPGKLTKWVNK